MYALLSAVQTFVADRFDNKNDRGATAVEYGLLVGLMAVAVVVAVVLLGPILNDLFSSASGAITDGTQQLETPAPTP